ncbi:MAG: hypothetical protein QOE93_1273 [Actinomycetota bacterium]|nr:hypothetical protein [Actinomycetota bacterium]
MAGTTSRPARPEAEDLRWAVLVVLAVAVAVVLLAVWAYSDLGPAMRAPSRTPHAVPGGHLRWLQAWSWWDGEWYVDIARRGYYFIPGRMSSVAFFPTYPLLIRGLSGLGLDPVLAGFLVSLACGVAGCVAFYAWAHEHLGREKARVALPLFLAYPCSFYLFGALYADALFLLLVVSAFVLLEHDRPVLAGLVGALATATRPVGIAVAIGLWLRAAERRGLLRRGGLTGEGPVRSAVARLRPDAGLLLAPVGLAAYCTYLWVRFGQPFAFVEAESGWRQSPGWRTWLKVEWFERMGRSPYLNAPHAHLVMNALVSVVALALVGLVFRRISPAYGWFVVVLLVGATVSTMDFVGMGRYVMTAFPLFAAVGDWAVDRPLARRALLAGSALLLVVTTQFHARNMLIS